MRKTAGLSAAALVAATLTTPAALGALGAGAATAAEDQQLRQVGERSALARSAVAAVRAHPQAAWVGDGQQFQVTDALVDSDGASHVRMDRTYRGLPVLGGDLVVHRGPGKAWRGTDQTLRSTLDLAVKPTVGKQAATKRALAPSPTNRAIRGERPEGEPRLVVDAVAGAPRLAWEVLSGGVQKDGTPSRLATYVDADTGKVLRTEQQIQTADGQGHTLYSGTVGLNTTEANGQFELKDPARGNTYTTDMENAEDSYLCTVLGMGCVDGTLFTDADNVWGDGTSADRASAAADAQYGTATTWDYYADAHGREGIFGDGSGSFNRVHYGQNYVNAFWDGEKMTYGDGDGVSFGPLTSLDVAGHEMSHGVTEHTAGLTYSGESGGLNEATSDIFGSMVEFYAGNSEDVGDYLIGEEFDLANGEGLRRMDQPSADGASVDCWDANVKNLDVHYSSGVGNHFFYLLAEGSGAKTINGVAHDSPTCDGSSLTGIGRDAAAQIWYRALSVYMTSGTDYAGARTATLNAAADLFGDGSAQQEAVAAAWSAVSVG